MRIWDADKLGNTPRNPLDIIHFLEVPYRIRIATSLGNDFGGAVTL